jgi:hypothetical protein
MVDLSIIHKALEPTRKGLEAAGFTLALAEANGGVELKVIAGAQACEECLVPKSLFRQMASDELRDAGLAVPALEILYPIDERRAAG